MEISKADHAFMAVRREPGERLRVVLLRSDDPHHAWLQAELARRLQLVGVLVEPGRAQQARLWRRHSRVAWAARGYQSWRGRITGRAAYRNRHFARPQASGIDPAIPRVEVDWISGERARTALAALSPDVIVVCGTTYVQPSVVAETLAINVHGGYLPQYRGNHGVFFAYERGDFEHIGASLHVLSADLDGGDLIDVVRPEVFPHDHDEHLYCRSVEAAIVRLCELLEGLESGEALSCFPQVGAGETFRHRDRTPAREARLWLRRRLGRHPVPRLRPNGPAGFRASPQTPMTAS